MKILRHKHFAVVLLILIIGVGFLLRKDNLYTWPRHGATFDEFAWTWQGINIIQKGKPISWSSQPQYTNKEHLIYQGAAFWIVTPYLEHPPIFGLVAGSFALLNGAKDMYSVTLGNIRPLALILGTLSIIILYFLTKELYDKKTALITSGLYATVPTIVVGSRLVQNENFFIPVWLFSLLLITKFIKTEEPIYRNIAAILCGLLILAKIPWIAGAGSIILIFLFLKKYKDLLKFFLIVIPFPMLYVLYGIYFDRTLFFNLMGLQLNRYDIYFTSIFALFQKPYLVDRFMTDGWIYFGWFAFILLLVRDLKKNYLIVLPLLSYFVVFLVGIPDEVGHGWYRYPFYPFLIISIALFIREYFNKNHILTFLFLIIVGTSLFQTTWVQTFGFSYFVFRIVVMLWGISLVPILIPIKPLLKISTISNYTWLVMFIMLNVWSVMLYNEQ